MGAPDRDRVQFPMSRFAPRQARRWIAELGRMGQERLDVVLLLVSELVTNGVRHSGAGPDEYLEVRVTRQGTVLRVDVQDPGPGFLPPRVMEPGPHGLQIVDVMSDRWGVERSPTIVWFELRVEEEGGPLGGDSAVLHLARGSSRSGSRVHDGTPTSRSRGPFVVTPQTSRLSEPDYVSAAQRSTATVPLNFSMIVCPATNRTRR